MLKKITIIEKTSNLILKYGCKNVTMDDIAYYLKISKKTLYIHFNNKEELLISVFEFEFKVFQTKIETCISQSDNSIIKLILIYIQTIDYLELFSKTLIYELDKNSNMKIIINGYINQYKNKMLNPIIENAIHDNYIKKNIDCQMVSNFFINVIYVIMIKDNYSSQKNTDIKKQIVLMSINCFLDAMWRNYFDEIILNDMK